MLREISPWLDIENIAQVEVTSEDPAHPIERAIMLDSTSGWRAGESGEQIIRLVFDEPQNIATLRLVFFDDRNERDQEFSIHWSQCEGGGQKHIVRQQYNFSPDGAIQEREQFAVELHEAKILELRIIPDRGGGGALASLEELRVA